MGSRLGAWYRTGKVSVTKDSNIITGVGTYWKSALLEVVAGDIFTVDNQSWYEIISVDDDEKAYLDRDFEGNTELEINYAIIRSTSGTVLTSVAGQVALLFNQKQVLLDEIRIWLSSTNATENITDSHGKAHAITTPDKLNVDHQQKISDLEVLMMQVINNTSFHIWKAYADDSNGDGISLDSDNKTYIGFAMGQETSEIDITDPSIFDWALFNGTGTTSETSKDSERLGGKLPSHYAKSDDVDDIANNTNTLDETVATLGNALGALTESVELIQSEVTTEFYSNITALREATITAEYVSKAIITNTDKAGEFTYVVGNHEQQVIDDPSGGVYIPLNSDPNGTNGVWVRVINKTIYAEWFGAIPLADCALPVMDAARFASVFGFKRVSIFQSDKKQSYINSAIHIRYSNIVLEVGRVVYGPYARLIITGSESESGVIKGLAQDAVDGSTVIRLSGKTTRDLYSVGSSIVIRGRREPVTGNPVNGHKQRLIVVGYDGDDGLVISSPIDTGTTEGFLATFDNPEYEANFGSVNQSRVYLLDAIRLTQNAKASDISLQLDINNTSVLNSLSIGDLVRVADAIEIKDYSNYYRSSGALVHDQISRISDIDREIGKVWLELPLNTPFMIDSFATIVKLNPIVNTHIIDAECIWSDRALTFSNAMEIIYGYRCSISDSALIGSNGYSWHRHGMRMSSCYQSVIQGFGINGAQYTGGGEGYGVSLYGATNCLVRKGRVTGTRHSVLLNRSSSSNLIEDVISHDCIISDFDLHGGNSNNNEFRYCEAYYGESYGGAQEFIVDDFIDNGDGTITFMLNDAYTDSVTTATVLFDLQGTESLPPVFGTMDGDVATLIFPSGHFFMVGEVVDISNVLNADYNGRYVLSSITDTSISYVFTGTVGDTDWVWSDKALVTRSADGIDGRYTIISSTDSPPTITANIASIPTNLNIRSAWVSLIVGYSKAAYRTGNPTHFYGDRDNKFFKCLAHGYESDNADPLIANENTAFDIQPSSFNVNVIQAEVVNCHQALNTKTNTKVFSLILPATFGLPSGGLVTVELTNDNDDIKVGYYLIFDGTGDWDASTPYKVVAASTTEVVIEADTSPTGVTSTVGVYPYLSLTSENVNFDAVVRRTRPEIIAEPSIDLGNEKYVVAKNYTINAHFKQCTKFLLASNIDGLLVKNLSFEFLAITDAEIPSGAVDSYISSGFDDWIVPVDEYAVALSSCARTSVRLNDFSNIHRAVFAEDCPNIKVVGNAYEHDGQMVVFADGGGNDGGVFLDNSTGATDTPLILGGGTSAGFTLQTI